MGLPTSERAQPTRTFSQYTFTWATDPGLRLSRISTKEMTKVSSADASGYSPGLITDILDLGISVRIGSQTYNKMIVSMLGYVILVGSRTTQADVITDVFGGPFDYSFPANIEAVQLHNHMTLAPWFMNQSPVPSSIDFTYVSTGLSAAQKDAYTKGITGDLKLYAVLDPLEGGVWVKRGWQHPQLGHCTIVRWISLPFNNSLYFSSSRLEFEVIICASGYVQFRYNPRKGITNTSISTESGAMIIVGPGTRQWRDLAVIHPDKNPPTRRIDTHGGGTFSTLYTDTSNDGSYNKEFTISLQAVPHWPGGTQMGAVLDFIPPLLQRRVLPRVERRRLDSYINTSTFYDDRRTVLYKSNSISYPTTLPVFYGNSSRGVAERQNLFAGSLTASAGTAKASADSFLNVPDDYRPDPFSEVNVSQLDYLETMFFNSGSYPATNLKQTLGAKSIIQFDLPLHHTLQLLNTTSSVYFYNPLVKAFQMPSPSDMRNSADDVKRISEDARGFNALGISIASGSTTLTALGTTQSLSIIGSSFDHYAVNDAATNSTALMAKSFGSSAEYAALLSQSIVIDIKQPFIIEKAIIEMPFQAGNGWFRDKTAVRPPSGLSASLGGFDIGGPAITVALHNNFIISQRDSYKELILSGTIIPLGDNTSSIDLIAYSGGTPRASISPSGFLALSSNPAAIVTPVLKGSTYTFTGSVKILTEAATANGIVALYSGSTSSYDKIDSLLIRDTLQLAPTDWSSTAVAALNPLGRFCVGSELQSGRSTFGLDHAMEFQDSVDSPFYVPSTTYTQISSSLTSLSYVYTAMAAIPLISNKISPYVLLPGDKLVFSISKCRPVRIMAGTDVGAYAYSHEALIPSGNIHVTLFGSYMRAGQELHDLGTTNLAFGHVENVVLDQYEVEPRALFSGSMSDAYITGSLVSKVPGFAQGKSILIVTGSRQRVFSRTAAGTFDAQSFLDDKFYSDTLVKASELAGTLRITSVSALQDERYYDSMLPRIDQIARLNGASVIFRPANGDGLIDPACDLGSSQHALIYYDISTDITATIGARSDKTWSRSYPFEPRYSTLNRWTDIMRQYECDAMQVVGSIGEFISLSPYTVANQLAYRSAQFLNEDTSDRSRSYFYAADAKGPYPPTAISHPLGVAVISTFQKKTDLIKTLYGIGNRSTVYTSSNGIMGRTNAPDYRSYSMDPGAPNQFYTFGTAPVIRGWKYGIINGLPQYSKCCWRTGKFGQFRDMLEQRQDTKFYYESSEGKEKSNLGASPVQVQFLNASGSRTSPINTTSSNLSTECTSSLPYFDDYARNR